MATSAASVYGMSTRRFFVGTGFSIATDVFNGLIDYIRIYNRRVSDDEIARLSNNEVIARGLVSDYRFNGDYSDKTGIAGDLTMLGGSLKVDNTTIKDFIEDSRVSANDNYMLTEIKGGVQKTQLDCSTFFNLSLGVRFICIRINYTSRS